MPVLVVAEVIGTATGTTAAVAATAAVSSCASAPASALARAGGATTFQFPQHQTPQRLAYTFGVDPHVSLKVDGVFAANTLDQFTFDPPLPSSWELVEGELYHPDQGSEQLPILYVFLVQSRDRSILTLTDMNAELMAQYVAAIASRPREAASTTSTEVVLLETLAAAGCIHDDIRRHMALSLSTRDQMLAEPSGTGSATTARGTSTGTSRPRATWFPKMYFPLNTAHWNGCVRCGQRFSCVGEGN